MTSIVELFPKCRKLAYDSRQQLAAVARNDNTTTNNHRHQQSAYTELTLLLEELNHQLDAMQELVIKETPEQRVAWNRKIQELRQEAAMIQQQGQQQAALSFHKHNTTAAAANSSYAQERQELLLRRRKKRLNSSIMNSAESDLQDLADERESLKQSNSMVLDILSQGQASLTGLIEQRQRLRGVNRVLADMADRLGLSQATMRIIERRDITDAYLVLAGIIVTCIVIYFVWL